jgi:hypothetical protein
MMNTEPWHIRRKIELEAAAPMKRKKVEAFVKVPLWWITTAADATGSPAVLVLIELLRLQWKTRRMSFPVPNARLKNLGVSREVKRRVLRDLQRAGLITVDRRTRKSPIVTLVSL